MVIEILEILRRIIAFKEIFGLFTSKMCQVFIFQNETDVTTDDFSAWSIIYRRMIFI